MKTHLRYGVIVLASMVMVGCAGRNGAPESAQTTTPRETGDSMAETVDTLENGSRIHYHEFTDKPLEPAFADTAALQLIDRHIEKYVGQIDTVLHEIVSDIVHIDIHVIRPTPERNFYTLVTSGMSDRPMHAPPERKADGYAELVICLPPDWRVTDEKMRSEQYRWPMELLGFLARYPHRFDTWLWYGSMVNNFPSWTPYASSTDLCGSILLIPLLNRNPQEFFRLKVSEEKTITFLSVVPLYKEELEFMTRERKEAAFDTLLDRFEANRISEYLNPQRVNVCK